MVLPVPEIIVAVTRTSNERSLAGAGVVYPVWNDGCNIRSREVVC